MKTIALFLACFLPAAALAQEAAAPPSQPAGKPVGFFKGLKDKLGLRIEYPNGQGAAAGSSTLYQPISGGQTFQTLFRHEDHDQAIQGRLQWPRAALTFVEYGRNLPCWTVKATIWADAKASHEETFKTCVDAKLSEVNDLGETTVTPRYLGFQGLLAAQPRFGPIPTTGESRTTGPNPPRLLFHANVDQQMWHQVEQVVINAAWVSGFYGRGNDLSHNAIFYDYRMWIAGFDPAGKRN